MEGMEELVARVEALHDDLKKIIVLKDLPFSTLQDLDLMRWRKPWRDVVLSSEYVLCFEDGELLLFSTTRRLWENISLDFLHLRGRRLLNFGVASEGLLLFVTECLEFYICNPLTKMSSRLPPLHQLVQPHWSDRSWLEEFLHTQDFGGFIAGVFVDTKVQCCQVLFSIIDSNYKRISFIHDSRSGWAKVEDDMGKSEEFATFTVARCNSRIFVLDTSTFASGGNRFLTFHTESQEWTSIEGHPTGKYSEAIVSIGDVVYIAFNTLPDVISMFELHEDEHGRLKLNESFSLPRESILDPLPQICNSSRLRLYLLGGEDTLFYMGVLRTKNFSGEDKKIVVRVLKCGVSHRVILLCSDWEEFPSSSASSPADNNFHLYKPTLA